MDVECLQSAQRSPRATRKGEVYTSTILATFFAGWATLAFALFNVGRFSFTLLLLASVLLTFSSYRFPRALLGPLVSLLLSVLIAFVISLLRYPHSEKVFTHLIQCVLGIGVMLGAASVNWERQFPRLRKMFAVIALVVLVFGVYQFVARKLGLRFAFLPITNQQLLSDEGVQRGFSLEGFTRVSSFFPEPSDLGRFMLWVFAMGYACQPSILRYTLLATGTFGILLSQSMGGLLGLLFFVTASTILRRDWRSLILGICFLGVGYAMFAHFLPQESAALVDRAKVIRNLGTDYMPLTQRFGSVQEHLHVFLKSPLLGHGLASTKREVGESIIVNAFMFLLIERGLVGFVLYFGPFFWVFFVLSKLMNKHDEIARTAYCILFVEIYCFSTFNMLYFPPCFFALGFAISNISRCFRERSARQIQDATQELHKQSAIPGY